MAYYMLCIIHSAYLGVPAVSLSKYFPFDLIDSDVRKGRENVVKLINDKSLPPTLYASLFYPFLSDALDLDPFIHTENCLFIMR